MIGIVPTSEMHRSNLHRYCPFLFTLGASALYRNADYCDFPALKESSYLANRRRSEFVDHQTYTGHILSVIAAEM